MVGFRVSLVASLTGRHAVFIIFVVLGIELIGNGFPQFYCKSETSMFDSFPEMMETKAINPSNESTLYLQWHCCKQTFQQHHSRVPIKIQPLFKKFNQHHHRGTFFADSLNDLSWTICWTIQVPPKKINHSIVLAPRPQPPTKRQRHQPPSMCRHRSSFVFLPSRSFAIVSSMLGTSGETFFFAGGLVMINHRNEDVI